MLVQIIVDNPDSWIVPTAITLAEQVQQMGFESCFLQRYDEIQNGEILILLSCEKIFKDLFKNKHNLVVHESSLPKGKGWSPVTWQVIEGENTIPVTLFEAEEKVDAGVIYGQEFIELDGTELINEIRKKQAAVTQKLILRFITNYPSVSGVKQQGEESFYPRRKTGDCELDTHKTIADNFNLLRVSDNERYPAFFHYREKKYFLKIEKAG